ncbi:MAG: hypothetical protein AAFX00_00005 [Pseudomonadota bacterium]
MKSPFDLSRLTDSLPSFKWPSLGTEVQIPVYMIHIGRDAEDYFFIFDFEEFVDRSRSGVFVRPALKIWAGRSDFSRPAFARQFREAFQREFEEARRQLKDGQGKSGGWLTWDLGIQGVGAMVSSLLANVVLLVALSAGRAILGSLNIPWLKGKSDATKLEESIEDTRAKVDGALERVDVSLHPDLYKHAWRGQDPGPMTGIDYDAWPLPEHVVRHLGDGESSAFWGDAT